MFPRLLAFPALATLTTLWGAVPPTATAQIVPDRTLGNENSVVVPNQNIRGIDSDRIDGGAVRGGNLFHSFEEFNIDEGRGAYFSNPDNIINILTRVTGGNLSQILGTLGVLGDANFFLINPNGIVFGPNARLDVGGSFFATTADGVLFENGFEFAASNPEAPPLLTINMPLGLNIRENPGTIVNQTLSPLISNINDPPPPPTPSGLFVPSDQTIALIGGQVRFESGVILSPGSRIEVGGLAEPGFIELDSSNRLTFPANVQRSDVLFTDNATIRADNNVGGSIIFNARNLEIYNSEIVTGVETFLNSPDSMAQSNLNSESSRSGDIEVNATESLIVDGRGSGIRNIVQPNSEGNAGNISIQTNLLSATNGAQVSATNFGNGNAGNLTVNTQNLSVRDGAQILAATFGSGNAGNLTITATDIEVVGTSADGQIGSKLTASVEQGATGNGGTLTINTQNLSVRDGGQINAVTFANGDGGNLIVSATDIEVIGTSADGQIRSGLFASVEPDATGNSNSLIIDTQRLSVRDGAFVSASTFGDGNAGNLTVTATDIEVVGTSADGQFFRALSASVGSEAIGNSNSLIIDTQRLSVRDGAFVSASTFGDGNAGNLTVTATDIEVVGTSADGQFFSALSASVGSEAIGNGGTLTIDTQNLSVREGAQISTDTFGEGNAGQLFIRATDSVEVTGNSSFITADVNSEATGNAGDLTINTQRLLVRDGARVSASTFEEGNAGNLTINTQRLLVEDGGQISASTFGQGDGGNLSIIANEIELVGTSDENQSLSGLFAQTNPESIGNAGNLTIDTQRLIVRDGARVSASTFGEGNAGQLFIRATDFVEVTGNSSFITANVNSEATGDGGDLTINTQRLLVEDGGQISASIFGSGEGGNLSIIANEIELVGTSDENQSLSGLFAQTNPESIGNAGNLTIDTQRLVVQDGARISTDTFGEGNAGQLLIRATDFVEVTGDSSFITADVNSEATGNAGDLTINTQRLLVRDGGQISASTFGEGNAGNLTINTQRLLVEDGGQISASTFGQGDGGNLIVTATDIEVVGTSADGQFRSGLFASVEPDATGNSNSLIIDTQRLSVRDGARVSASTFGEGDGGNLIVTATNMEFVGRSTDGQFSSGLRATVGSQAMGNAGTLTINTQNLSVREGAQILASTFGDGNVGSLTITATDVELVGRSADGQFSSALAASVEQGATGNSGTLRIDTQRLSVREGAQILAATFGSGNAGNLTINATDVELVGRSADGQFSSALSASVEEGATGNGNTLTINTQNLSVRDGAQVTAVTFADGDGGNLIVTANDIEVVGTSADGQFRSGLFASVEPDATGNSNSLIIDTQRLSVRDGAFVSTSTFSDGNAGNLTVTATDVELIGTSADGQFPSSLGAEATSESTGRAGTLTVNADNLTVRDGATVDVRSESSEPAGDLIINAPTILLDNEASLNAETTAGQGDIILNTSDLRLRNNSNITTNATGEATGGNIEINTDNLIAIEDSDISANAQAAFGGQVIINADAIFGTQFRQQPTGASDITATSELGASFSGTVELNTEIDPSSGLIELPQSVVDPAALIAQDPCRQRGDSQFIITGRGGIAPNPVQDSSALPRLVELESLLIEPVISQPNNSFQSHQQQTQKRDNNPDNSPVDTRTIVPARGWIRNEKGEVILVGYDPTKTGVRRQPENLNNCQP